MTEIFAFSLVNTTNKKLSEVLNQKKEKRELSSWVCEACKEKLDRETKGEMLDKYIPKTANDKGDGQQQHQEQQQPQRPQTELDILPKMYEPLSPQILGQLSDKDVWNLRKMTYWNVKILDDYVDSLRTQHYGGNVSGYDDNR
jgi:6-phosphogluconate dehydrogenase